MKLCLKDKKRFSSATLNPKLPGYIAAALALLATGLRAQVFTPTPAPAGDATAATSGPFVHPGVFSSQNELETMRRRLATRMPSDPMVAGCQSVMASRYADVNNQPEPVAIVTRADKSPTPATRSRMPI